MSPSAPSRLPPGETLVGRYVSLPPPLSPVRGRGAEEDRPYARMPARCLTPSREEDICGCWSCRGPGVAAHGPYCYCPPCVERDPLNGLNGAK